MIVPLMLLTLVQRPASPQAGDTAEGRPCVVVIDSVGGRTQQVVVRTDGATLRTEVLRYSQVKNQVSSDKPFVFDEPTRHIEGKGFTSDPDFKVVTALQPQGRAGQFTLPNQ